MNQTQYSHACEALLRMQDEFDAKSSVLLIPSDSNNSNSLDGTFDYLENNNYHLGEKELLRFEQLKQQKYLPTFNFDHSISGTNDRGKLSLWDMAM